MSNNIDINLAFQAIGSLYNVPTDQIKRVLDNAFQISNNIPDNRPDNKPKIKSKDIIL